MQKTQKRLLMVSVLVNGALSVKIANPRADGFLSAEEKPGIDLMPDIRKRKKIIKKGINHEHESAT